MPSLKDGKMFYQSKGIVGGIILIVVAAYEAYHGDYVGAIDSFGMGLAAIGIRSAQR